MKFLKVDSVETARKKLFTHAQEFISTEALSIDNACGRVLAENISSLEDIPSFKRSTVDGYAVLSHDTGAAGDSIPVFLKLKGKVEMGLATDVVVESGECVEVPTGGMIPDGADSVVMVEYVESFGEEGKAIYSSVAVGENVVQIGEDVKKDQLLLRKGKLLLPSDIGMLAAAGIIDVKVFSRPTMTIISTGDELIYPSVQPRIGQIRDVNTYSLTALAEKIGFKVVGKEVLNDDEQILEQSVTAAMKTSDIVVVSGGSSQGEKDKTAEIISRVSKPGVFTHGLAIKPGKPTIIGYDIASKTLLVGLPGHPVSAMIVFEILLSWMLRRIHGSSPPLGIPAKIDCNVASSPGRLTCLPAKLEWVGDSYLATPIFKKSGLISTLSEADGYFTVDRNSEGLTKGQTVKVYLF